MSANPGFHHRVLGDTRVTALSDGMLDLPLTALLGIPAAEASALLVEDFLPPSPCAPVNAYLIQTGSRTILVDTGGGGIAPTVGRLLPNLRAAGVAPESVDLVLLTHLHSDHSGGLARPDGTAIFPNAELGVPAAEAAFWLDPEQEANAPEARRPSFAQARAAVAPYQSHMRLLSAGEVVPGVRLVPLPGHTPGHSGYLVEDGAHSILIWGDVMHVPTLQSARPEVAMAFDSDPAQAIATRREVLAQVAAAGTVIAGMHLDFPGFSRVRRSGTGFVLVPERWSAGT